MLRMSPPLPSVSRLIHTALPLRPVASILRSGAFASVPVANASSQAQRRRRRDPYALAQAQQRKAANLTRRKELTQAREAALGDPVRGITTPFVESFDTGGLESGVANAPTDVQSPVLNHFVKPAELQKSLQHSFILSQPIISSIRGREDPALEKEALDRHSAEHEIASTALSRILNLQNAKQKDKTRVNIQRCIETFGRHNTDLTLRPKAPSIQSETAADAPQAVKTPRAGLDTGSSEVQIAILTAKIRVLADRLELKGGQKDKVNKRNLRILVHKRQKLLAYLRRHERGSERWQNLVTTLGLTDGTWKGEISL